MRTWMAVSAAVCALLGAGCGEDDKQAVEDVVADYLEAYGKADAKGVCALTTEASRVTIGRNAGAGGTCEQGLREATFASTYTPERVAGYTAGEITVEGDRAKAYVGRDGGRDLGLDLVKTGGSWRVDGPFGD